MKKINKIYAVMATAGLLLGSCNVDPELTSSYPEDTIWSNETNLQLYINGFYSLVAGYYSTTEESCTDILKSNNPVTNENAFVFGSMPITPASNIFGNWDNRHLWQLDCCRALSELNEHRDNFSTEFANRAEAEFRFFRAMANFDLAKRYGASFILYKELPVLGQKEHPRCTPDECWDFIAEDLDFAARHLPMKDEVASGKITSGAAYGMLARAMLYAGRWEAASDAALEVKKQGYTLNPDYGKLFLNRRTNPVANDESIIEFGYKYENLDYSFDRNVCPPSDGGYAMVSPTENLVSEYEMADGRAFDWNNADMAANPYEGREPRFYASILYNGCQWKGETLYTYEGSQDGYALGGGTTCTGYYMRKLCDPEISKKQMRNSDLTYYYMRYAEVLLIYAEAMAMQDKLPEALGALNEVRARVQLPAVSASSRDSFMKLLRHERMVELAFEGHRLWDLRRWNLAVSVLNGTHMKGVKPVQNGESFVYEIVDCDAGKTRVFLEKYNRFPVPVAEIQQNTACTQFDEWK